MDISQRIKSLLPTKGIKTIAALERACGVSNGSISKWGRGAYMPTSTNLSKVASFLDVSVDYLLGSTNDPSPSGQKKPPLSNEKGSEIVKQVLADSGLLDADGELSEESAKVISDFIGSNAELLKKLIQNQS